MVGILASEPDEISSNSLADSTSNGHSNTIKGDMGILPESLDHFKEN